MEKLILDSDVLLNWLTMELETASGRKLWVAPATILELGERRAITNLISLLSIFEIRYVLRRKKKADHKSIEKDLKAIRTIAEILPPAVEDLGMAERLQADYSLDPFDSIMLAQAISSGAILITRDIRFLDIAAAHATSLTPEQYIESRLS
jgi:predicted nucleic acid-binding protein